MQDSYIIEKAIPDPWAKLVELNQKQNKVENTTQPTTPIQGPRMGANYARGFCLLYSSVTSGFNSEKP